MGFPFLDLCCGEAGHALGDVRCRADRDKEAFAVWGELDVTGDVVAGCGGEAGDDDFWAAGGVEFTWLVGEAEDGVEGADIDPSRIGAGGVEGDAEGDVHAFGEDFATVWAGFAVGRVEDADAAGGGFGDEDVAVGGGTEEAGVFQAFGEALDGEARRDLWGCSGGGLDDGGGVADGAGGVGFGEVGWFDFVRVSGGVGSPVAEGGGGLGCWEGEGDGDQGGGANGGGLVGVSDKGFF